MHKPKPLPESLMAGGVKRKIIYVDDMNFNQLTLKKAIGQYYEIYPAANAVKMYEILEEVTPDVILLDVNLPEVNGYDVIKGLKADERYAGIMVIFLTYNSDRASVVKGLGLGAADYVVKPLDATKIIESIESQFFTKKDKDTQKDENDGNPRILVVDDVSSMLRTVHNALHDKYKLFLLSKPEEVVDFLLNNKIDLILLDYLMPVFDGFELIPKIKALPSCEFTPIIMVTTEGTFANVNEAVVLGAVDFIVKPFDPEELDMKIKKYIKTAELQRENKENEFLMK